MTVQNSSTLSANTAVTHAGSAIYNVSGGVVTVDRSMVIDNIGEDYGGGIYNNGTLNVQNGSAVDGNTSLEDDGGGIYNDDNGKATVEGSSVDNNFATDYGGGIYNLGTLDIHNASAVNANSAGDGGGIYNYATLNMLNSSTVSANVAADEGGGIFSDGTTTVDGSTISTNTATYGAGIFGQRYTTVTGSRILYNTATTNGGGVYNDWDNTGATSVTGSCLVGNSDVSFFNNRIAQQIAAGNWWGVATGPNNPGADTTAGIVDTSGYLTAPILGCAPDLQVGKANDVGSSAAVGSPFHWTLTVTNTGLIDGTFNAGQTILQDNLPAGPAYATPVTGSFVDVTNGVNIFCSLAGNTLTCTATGANVILGADGGSFDVAISAIPNAPGTLVNPTSGGNCWVDPDGNLTESDESNNNCPANLVNVMVPNIYLPLVLK